MVSLEFKRWVEAWGLSSSLPSEQSRDPSQNCEKGIRSSASDKKFRWWAGRTVE